MLSRTVIAIGALTLVVAGFVRAQELKPSWDGSLVRVAAPQLHFLVGKPLENVRNGRAVAFDFQLSLTVAGAVTTKKALERFVISYDLWEEKFSVTRIGRERQESKQISHLAQNATEAWCLDNLAVATLGLRGEQRVNLQLEVRAAEMKPDHPVFDDDGISLTALVELFSRPARAQQARWNLQVGNVLLNDIRKKGS